MKVVKEKNTMENTKKDWIITHTKSEDACVEIKRFFGTEEEMEALLKSMAAECNLIKEAMEYEMDEDETDVSDMISDCEYDEDEGTYSVVVYDDSGDEKFTASELSKIKLA